MINICKKSIDEAIEISKQNTEESFELFIDKCSQLESQTDNIIPKWVFNAIIGAYCYLNVSNDKIYSALKLAGISLI